MLAVGSPRGGFSPGFGKRTMWRYDWGVSAGGCSFPDVQYNYFTHICSEITPHGYFTVPPWILTKTVQRYFVKSHTQEDTNCSVTWQIAAHLCFSTSFGHQCFHSECHFYLILSLLSNYWLLNEICQNIFIVISHLPQLTSTFVHLSRISQKLVRRNTKKCLLFLSMKWKMKELK